MAPKKGGLGKGLDALFIDNTTEQGAVSLRIAEIEPNKDQPRKDFDEAALADLADSIAEHGIIQPLLVRPTPGGTYQLVAGERRWRAARMAGLLEVPVIIRELSDEQTVELALIENLQRQDLNAVEEALGYQTLQEQYAMTQEQIAKVIGKSRPAVANALRLLGLPEEVLALVKNGTLSAGHGRTLLAFGERERILQMANETMEKGLSVRQLEKLSQQIPKKTEKKAAGTQKNNYYTEIELSLTEHLGRKIAIKAGRKSKKIEIEFFDDQDLKELVDQLANETIKGDYYGLFLSEN